MTTSLKTVAACAALALASASAALAQLNILYIANSNSDAYETFATSGQFNGSSWTHKATGTGAEQIGGDLDATRVLGGSNQTVKTYLQSFDLVIVGVPTNSANFVDGVDGADWAGINVPILFNAAVAARASGGRVGMTSSDNFVTFTHGDPVDTSRVSNSARSDRLFASVTDATNLYSAVQSDTINGVATFGTGELISSLTNGTTNHHGIIYWTLDATNAAGHTLAADRAFLPLKGNVNDLTADGQIVLGNVINELTTIPEPGSAATLAALAALSLAAFRRR